MRIQKLKIENFRGFRELEITFPDSNLAVFIGSNGSGKSSILDCLAISLSNFVAWFENITRLSPDSADLKESSSVQRLLEQGTWSIRRELKPTEHDHHIRSEADEIGIHLTINTDGQVLSWRDSYSWDGLTLNSTSTDTIINYIVKHFSRPLQTNPNANIPIFTYYQINRAFLKHLFLNDEQRLNREFSAHSFLKKKKQKRYTYKQLSAYENVITKNIVDFRDFSNWFEFQESLENEMKIKEKDFNVVNRNLEIVRKAITTFLQGFSQDNFVNLHVERNPFETGFNFPVAEEDISLVIAKNGQNLPLGQLSAGEQQVLLMIGDIARRLAIANPGVEDALQGSGIVLIDEIELHLHPQWQREVLPALQRTFPNIQFIVTTHSPQVLSNVERENVFILEDSKLVEVTPFTKGRDSNSILYELQGVEERPAPFKEKLRTLYRLIDEEKIAAAKAVLQELTEQWGEHDTEIVRANMHLNLLMPEQ